MTYKKHLIILLSIIGVLVLLYIGSIIFDYDMRSSRSSSYVWLDSKAAEKISRIVVSTDNEIQIDFIKKNDKWFSVTTGIELPVRASRIDDFLGFLTTRSAWPVRSASASSHESFGLGDDSPRITIYGEQGVILDVLVGYDDLTERETFIRRAGQNEVRSGDNALKSFFASSLTSWYNLRLIPESEEKNVNAGSIQRLTVYSENETRVFTRNSRRWDISGFTVLNPDFAGIENYVANVLNMEGEDFIDDEKAAEYDFNYSRITLEFGNGNIITIRVSGPDEMNKRYAKVSNSNYNYVIPLWTTVRVFRSAESFEVQ